MDKEKEGKDLWQSPPPIGGNGREDDSPLTQTKEARDFWLRQWDRDAVVDGEVAMTREDVERLIAINGGTSEYLYLGATNLQSANLQGTNLWGANLQGANLRNANLQGTRLGGAKLQGANLTNADLRGVFLGFANLQGIRLGGADLQDADLGETKLQGAHLFQSNLQGANLTRADLQGADLRYANLQGADLMGVLLDERTNLEDVTWDAGYISAIEREEKYKEAQSSYRQLKTWHQNHSYDGIAGEFHFREWECRRKLAQQQKKQRQAGQLQFYRFLFGYGERPWRIVGWAASIMLLFTSAYFPYSSSFCSSPSCWETFGLALGKAFYFSGVSFTALGYGEWVNTADIGPLRYLGFVESLIGVLLLALFLVTFTKKMMRD